MIRFDINSQSYCVEWDNLPYECLYMIYCPLGNLKRITNGKIEILPDTRNIEYITCPKRLTLQGCHSHLIPFGSYIVKLCTAPFGEDGEVLKEQRVYIGQKIHILYGMSSSNKGNAGFTDFVVQSDCFIPVKQIWISYKAFAGEDMKQEIDTGIRVFLPEMRQNEERKFFTNCLIPEGGYRYARIEVSEKISDCIQIMRY